MKWCCNQDHSPCFSIEYKGSDAAAIKKYIKMHPAAQIVPLKEFDQIAMHTHEKLREKENHSHTTPNTLR